MKIINILRLSAVFTLILTTYTMASLTESPNMNPTSPRMSVPASLGGECISTAYCGCEGCKVAVDSEDDLESTQEDRSPYTKTELYNALFNCEPSQSWLWGSSSFDTHIGILKQKRLERIEKLNEKTIAIGLTKLMQVATRIFVQPTKQNVNDTQDIDPNYNVKDMTRIISNLFDLQATLHEAKKLLPTLTMDDFAHLEVSDLKQILMACKLQNEIKYYDQILAFNENETSVIAAHTAEEKADMLQQLKSGEGAFDKEALKACKNL